MTTLFIVRHSEPIKDLLGNYKCDEIEQLQNEKIILSVNGEAKAYKMSKLKELQNIDALYSSNYVRTMSTAKYIAENNQIKLNVDQRLGERKFGVNSLNELPQDFFEHQFSDWNYKINDGESLLEVSKRMQEALLEILKNNENKRVVLVSHGTALSVMLKKWCEIKLNEETKLVEIYFNNNLVFDGNWQLPELFKLVFDKDELIGIKNIKIDY